MELHPPHFGVGYRFSPECEDAGLPVPAAPLGLPAGESIDEFDRALAG